MCIEIGEGRKHFGAKATNDAEATKLKGEGGAFHVYKDEERNTIARLFNKTFVDDEYVKDYFPIDPYSDDLWHVMYDGMVLIRSLVKMDKDAVDMRAVNKGKNGVLNTFQTLQNIDLGISAAKGKLKLVGINASDFLEKIPHKLLGVCFQLARLLSVDNINLKDTPQLIALLEDGETLEDLLKLPPEHILIRWINYHLRAAGKPERQVKNLGKDLEDSQVMMYVLN